MCNHQFNHSSGWAHFPDVQRGTSQNKSPEQYPASTTMSYVVLPVLLPVYYPVQQHNCSHRFVFITGSRTDIIFILSVSGTRAAGGCWHAAAFINVLESSWLSPRRLSTLLFLHCRRRGADAGRVEYRVERGRAGRGHRSRAGGCVRRGAWGRCRPPAAA